MKKRLITTSIAYANASPHIGFALELIQADVLKRHYRQRGDSVFLLTGTDENGLKIFQTALRSSKATAGVKSGAEKIKIVQSFVDKVARQFKRLAESLKVEVDSFVRTSDKKRHYKVAQELWRMVKKRGDIEKRRYRGWYCVGCESFKKDADLVDGRCPAHNIKPELVEEENYFFKLSKYSSQIKKLIKSNEVVIKPAARRNEILAFLEKGAEDISISRPYDKLPWGVPVPAEIGAKKQVIYVWFDALANYLSGSLPPQSQSSDLASHPLWNEDTIKTHMIGKDIIRFHAVIWLGMLLSAKLPLPDEELVHGFISSEGRKMSKSLGNVVDPFQLIEKYGSEPLRYYLLREIPSGGDGDFSSKRFEERYRSDLANSLGNLLQRVLVLINKNKVKIKPNDSPPICARAAELTEAFKYNEALEEIFKMVENANIMIDREKPWELFKNSPAGGDERSKGEKVLNSLYRQLETIGASLLPFLPETSEKIIRQLRTFKPKPLFPRF